VSTNNAPYNLARPLGFLFIIFLLTSFLDRAIQEGMFFDGVTYAAISRNLAIGKGTFWDVYFRGNWRFSEHPPLMFGIQALFFKTLGDHYLTERFY
jgi:4-amino-4-deoxy-L-arabinose transferase-like glycosyltransferase